MSYRQTDDIEYTAGVSHWEDAKRGAWQVAMRGPRCVGHAFTSGLVVAGMGIFRALVDHGRKQRGADLVDWPETSLFGVKTLDDDGGLANLATCVSACIWASVVLGVVAGTLGYLFSEASGQ